MAFCKWWSCCRLSGEEIVDVKSAGFDQGYYYFLELWNFLFFVEHDYFVMCMGIIPSVDVVE